jgi:ferric-dicitrate binding protein FerR (iron transport regulator)
MRTITKYIRPACFWIRRDLFLSKISFFCLFYFLMACSGGPRNTYRVSEQLPDGTKVFKDDLTIIRLDSGFNHTNRKLYLNGKSVFEVRYAEDRPFIIRTRYLEITVRDSSTAVFSIDASDTTEGGGEEVDLLRGTLKVAKAYRSTGDNEPVIIRSGEMVMVNRGIDLIENEKFDTTIWKHQHNAND